MKKFLKSIFKNLQRPFNSIFKGFLEGKNESVWLRIL
nr:MAG TPA: hypothetical protein [Myoviridae sp. ctict13]